MSGDAESSSAGRQLQGGRLYAPGSADRHQHTGHHDGPVVWQYAYLYSQLGGWRGAYAEGQPDDRHSEFFQEPSAQCTDLPGQQKSRGFRGTGAFFQGEEHKLQFVSLLPASAGRSGPHLFQVQWDADSEASLRVALQPFPPSQDDGDAEIEDVTILENISNFQVAYWGAKEEGDQPEWHNEWLDLQALPEMIRVDIELENEKPWPSIVVALRMAQHSDEQ